MGWIWIDQVNSVEPGKFAVGTHTFPADIPLLRDHFPGSPIVPGALQIDLIAQLGGHCARALAPKSRTVLTKIKSAKFHHSWQTGQTAVIRVELPRLMSRCAVVKGTIHVNGVLHSEAEIQLAFVAEGDSVCR